MSKEQSFLLGWTPTKPDEEGALRPGFKLGRRSTESDFRLLLKMFGVKENNCVCMCVRAHARSCVLWERTFFFFTSGAFLTLKLPLHGNRTPPLHHVETTGLGLPTVGQQDTPFGHWVLFFRTPRLRLGTCSVQAWPKSQYLLWEKTHSWLKHAKLDWTNILFTWPLTLQGVGQMLGGVIDSVLFCGTFLFEHVWPWLDCSWFGVH